MAKSRINTEELLHNMLNKQEPEDQEKDAEVPAEAEEVAVSKKEPAARGRKPLKKKNTQISAYITEDQEKELRLQDAMREKENDKSAIVRAGLDIVLGMSSETYSAMKAEAAANGKQLGELVEEAVKAYLK